MTANSRRVLSRVLKFFGLAVGLVWICSFFFLASQYANKMTGPFWYWYAVIASSNNFAFFFLAGLPVLLLLAPAGLLMEWLEGKAEKIDASLDEEADAWRRQRDLARLPPPIQLSNEEQAMLEEETRRRSAASAAYVEQFLAGRERQRGVSKIRRSPRRR
jgi:hypothetical protein